YKHPPPAGKYGNKLKSAVSLMRRPPVLLTPDERRIVCVSMAEKLNELGAEVIDLCMTEMHFHGLARFDGVGEWVDEDEAQSRGMAIPRLYNVREMMRVENGKTLVRVVPGMTPQNVLQDGRDPLPRHVIGIAKKHASHELRNAGFKHEGGVFATRCKVKPIEDRDHKARVEEYVVEHKDEGG